MSFLDDELLALAGDVSGSDDDAGSIASDAGSRPHSRSQSRTGKHSPSQARETSAARRSASPAVPAAASPKKRSRAPSSSAAPKRSRKKPRRDDDDDTESEGEIKEEESDDALSDIESGEEPESGDAPMELESSDDEETAGYQPQRSTAGRGGYSDDDDASDAGEPSTDLYPLEGKYIDHADKAKLLAMTEIDREAVLADRAAKLEREHLDRQLRNLLKSRNADAAGGSGGDSAGLRKSGRTKSAPKKNEEVSKRGKLEELRRQREERKAGGKTTIADEDASKPLLDDDDDDVGRMGDSQHEEREITLDDVNRAKIGRTGLAKLCDYPNFEDVVKDCFVRVSLGIDKTTSTSVYRVCQISGITTGKSYSLLDGRRTTTTHLLVSHGGSTRSFSMEYMSDGRITTAEFNRYKKQLEIDSVPLPTVSFLHQKTRELKDLDARVLTEAELNAIIRKRKEGAWDPVTHALKLGDRRHKREEAVRAGRDDEVERLDKEIQELEDQEREHKEHRPGHSVVAMRETQMARMARINAENRKRNQEEIRRAELEEKRLARAQAEEAKKRGEAASLANPFARVKTVVKFRHDVGKKKEEDAKNADGGEDAKKEDVGVGIGAAGGAGAGAAKPKLVRKGVEDVIAAMDIEIEL